MRTASIAALVIVSGTLAALPFRLSPSPPDIHDAATGPNHSVLDQAAVMSHVKADPEIDSHPPDEVRHVTRTVARRQSSVPSPSWAPEQRSPREPSSDMPLTFDDLMIPIDSPAPIAQRFNATVGHDQIGKNDRSDSQYVVRNVRRSKIAGDFMTAKSTQNPARNDPPKDHSIGSMASARPAVPQQIIRREATTQLPSAPPDQRRRHWISQP